MNILVANSRGVDLHNLIKDEVVERGGLTTKIVSGGTYQELVTDAKLLIPPPGHSPSPPHVYLMAGIPDITKLIKEYKFGKSYKAVILENEEKIFDNIKLAIDNTWPSN